MPRLIRQRYRLLHRAIDVFLGEPRILFKYLLVGGTSATLEFLLFNVLYSLVALPLLAANGAAIAVCIVFSFTLQKHWTFRDSEAVPRQLRRYALMISISVALNNGLMYLFVARWGWHPALAKLVQIGAIFAWNFSLSRLVVFTHPRDGRRDA